MGVMGSYIPWLYHVWVCELCFMYEYDGLRFLKSILLSNFLGFVCLWKINSFLMFGSVMENKLKNTFQYLVMSWKMSWKITY
jgi:hypothetical protein